MSASRADVVLLNSDTVVTRGWLDALVALRGVRSAHRDGHAVFEQRGDLLVSALLRRQRRGRTNATRSRSRAALADAAVPTYPDLPTGVGFCMFVRRAAIDAIGTFDLGFGAGYGEENDFCLRAARAGWRNVLADDAFVVHAGRPLVRRDEGRARRAQPRAAARPPSALRGDGAALHRCRSAAPAARGGAVATRARRAACGACCTSFTITAAAPRRTCAS